MRRRLSSLSSLKEVREWAPREVVVPATYHQKPKCGVTVKVLHLRSVPPLQNFIVTCNLQRGSPNNLIQSSWFVHLPHA